VNIKTIFFFFVIGSSASYGQEPSGPAVKQSTIKKSSSVINDVKKQSAAATFSLYPYSETIQGSPPENALRHPGCSCGLDANPRHNSIAFSPAVITAKVGQPVTVRYDGSLICRKQTIRDLNGTVHPPTDQVGNLVLLRNA
jgi:hypothetical protein